MRTPVSRRALLTTSILAGVTFFASTASAAAQEQTAPVPAPRVNTTAMVDQANAQLAQFGVNLDRNVAQQFDATANANIDAAIAPYAEDLGLSQQTSGQVVEQPLRLVEGAVEDAASNVQAEVERALPNYSVRTDIQSQIMAATPGEVVRRVPGSWFDAPAVPEESKAIEQEGMSLYGPGTPIYLGGDSMCTLAVTGTDADGRKIGITAGHCGEPGDAVRSADSFWVGDSGTVVSKAPNADYSIIEFGSNAKLSNSYNGIFVDSVGGGVAPGQEVCKTGVATGYTCGLVWSADERMTMSQVCAGQGDSGAPVVAGRRMVGIVSGGVLPNYDLSCRTPLQGALYMPSLSVNMDKILIDLDESQGPGRGFQPTAS